MANHIRQQIREAVGVLLTGLTTTGTNVFQSRQHRIPEDSLPALVIYSTEEESEAVAFGGGSPLLDRTLTLVVEGYAKEVSNVDDTADTISKEVETALAGDLTLGGLAQYVILANTLIEYEGETDSNAALVTLSFGVLYRTRAATPDVVGS